MKPGRFVSYSLLYIGVLVFTGFLFRASIQDLGLSPELVISMGLGLVSVFTGLHRIRRPELEETPKRHGILTILACIALFGITGWFLSVTVL